MTLDAIQLREHLKAGAYNEFHHIEIAGYPISFLSINGELILQVILPNNHILLQKIYSHKYKNEDSAFNITTEPDNISKISFATAVGQVSVEIAFTVKVHEYILWCSSIYLDVKKGYVHRQEEREIILFTSDYDYPATPNFHTEQVEGRTGHCFVDFGKNTSGCLLYLQDLGATQQLAEFTQVSYKDTVKIEWSQLGFKFPHTTITLPKGEKYCIQKSFIAYHTQKPKNAHKASELYLELLSRVYPALQKPAKKVIDVVDKAHKILKDLTEHKGCWKQVEDAAYLNAYVNSYDTPPESMVQMALLRPLYEFQQLHGSVQSAQLIEELSHNMIRFYDEELGIIHRWLPVESYLLDFEEEQKRSFIMDSWYLLYPLLQLATLFEQGFKNEQLEKQLEKSLLYIRKAAKEFDYEWPIFFNLYTLEILKDEGNPNEYGEIDTAGLYIQIMLKCHKRYKKEIYLREAKRASKKLKTVDLESLYQSNNTAYSAEALVELYILTGQKKNIESAEILLGNIIRNCALWDMQYGNAKKRESFFGLLPLKKASYTAAFEEHETVAIFHRILHLIQQHRIEASIHVLFFMNEYIQYALHRLPYYFPPNLPTDVFADEAKTGFVNPNIWIPVEDLGDGWEAIGQIGQEVYGGAAFFNLCLHHVVILNENMYVISSLPFVQNSNNNLYILGAAEQEGILWIKDNENNAIAIEINKERQQSNTEYIIKANDTVKFILK